MKNKYLVKTGILAMLMFALFCVTAEAQYGIYQLPSGTTVVIKTETVPPSDSSPFGNAYSSVTDYYGETVHRVMFDNKSKTYFGYDLAIEKLGETGKFKVTIKPLSKALDKLMNSATSYSGEKPNYINFTEKSLPKYPDAVTIDDGDTITLDILENRKTNMKIADFIKITAKPHKFAAPYFSEREKAKDFTLNDVNLMLDKPEISINGQKSNHGTKASGNVVWVYIPGKGRFIFSFRPQTESNFQKTGMILDNKIIFEYAGEKYEITNRSPVLNSGGKWNLWVMFDQNYQPSNDNYSNAEYVFGAADKIDFLFDKK